jgi:tetratricopeptide (TPR) repeat protein
VLISLRRLQFLALLILIGIGTCLAGKSEHWITVRSPNFLVLTNAGEKQGRRVAYQFEMIRAVFRQFFNVQGTGTDQPVTIIAAQDEETLKTLLPEYWEKRGLSHPAGFYLGSAEKNYVALRLDVSMETEVGEPFETVYHEYVHYLTRRAMAQLPLWMVEGLAEFYGNTRIEGNRVLVGMPSAPNIMVLRQERALPLETLFAVTASSPYYHEENKASIFYAESWVLTHYLITRDWREHTHRFTDFVLLLGKNIPPTEAARQTIGDLSKLDEELFRYIGLFAFSAAHITPPAGVNAADFQAQPASEAQSLAIRADFMARDRHLQQAQQMIEEVLKSDPQLADAHETMGFILTQQGKTDEATKWYGEAVALNSQSSMANYSYAVSLFKGRLDDATADKAESSLRTAIKISPEFAPAYAALAWLLAMRHKDLNEAYRMVNMAAALEPGDVHNRIIAAELLGKMGRYDDAIHVGKIAMTMAKTLEEENQAEQVISNAEEYKEFAAKMKERQQAAAATANAPGSTSPTASTIASSATQDPDRPPILQHRDAAAVDVRPLMKYRVISQTPPQRPELLLSRKVVEGTIKEAKCSGQTTLEYTVDSPAGTMQLFSDHYMQIPYNAINFTPQGIMNPCTDPKGWHARITYHPAKTEPAQGEMLEVGFIK